MVHRVAGVCRANAGACGVRDVSAGLVTRDLQGRYMMGIFGGVIGG